MDTTDKFFIFIILPVCIGICAQKVEGRTCIYQTMTTYEYNNVTLDASHDETIYMLRRRWYCRGHYEKPIYMYATGTALKYMFFLDGANFTGWIVGSKVCSWVYSELAGEGNVATPDLVEKGNWKVQRDFLDWETSPDTVVACTGYYNGWAVFGIVIGVILGLVLLVVVIAVLCTKCTKKKSSTSPSTVMHNRDTVQQYPQVIGSGAGARTEPEPELNVGATAYDPYQNLSAKEQEAYGQPPGYSEVSDINPSATIPHVASPESLLFGGEVPPAYHATDVPSLHPLSYNMPTNDAAIGAIGGTDNPVFQISTTQ